MIDLDDPVDVAALSELVDGKGLGVTVHGRRIAIFKVGEKVFAIDGICPHQGGALDQGRITVDRQHVICPRHAWCFNLETGAKRESTRRRLPTYSVEIRGDRILVGAAHVDPDES